LVAEGVAPQIALALDGNRPGGAGIHGRSSFAGGSIFVEQGVLKISNEPTPVNIP
jgi:hypothetical protein